ncbi:hypothetical protein ACJ73_05702 [Blastomyces percursus]|uniref:Uncharacterized protein n=1 Tax=Blastomyces percursus TaxID=1658174 RepID=A0A1J9R374_9EURO|nr:hypothetical protein ACJ73_05702 [Blastomyces percursus]
MSEQIRQEVEYQCSKHKINHRATTDPQKPSITDTFSPLSQNERKKKHRKLKKQSLDGSSWARIEPRWMVLALKNAAVKSFEEKRWGLMEIEALNAYVRVLRAYAEKYLLSTAYSKILEEYHQCAPLRQDRSEAFPLNESRKRVSSSTNNYPSKKRYHRQTEQACRLPQDETGHEPNPANANGQHTQPTTSGIFQSDNMPVLGNPSSEQQGVQLEREQDNANDHSSLVEYDTHNPSHTSSPCSYPVIDPHTTQSTVFTHNSVAQWRNVNVTNGTAGFPSQSQEITRLVSVANAWGNISHSRDQRPVAISDGGNLERNDYQPFGTPSHARRTTRSFLRTRYKKPTQLSERIVRRIKALEHNRPN